MDKKETIDAGKFVGYSYKLYNDADGSLLFETPADAPDTLVYGVTRDVVPGLLTAMKGLGTGDKFEVTLPPVAAFGDRYEENVITLEKKVFMRDGHLVAEVTVGAELPMMTQEGFMVRGKVLEITTDHVKMDFNHPFAGLTVRYEGIVDEVRDATPEELTPARGCGCGCGHDHCHDDGGSCSCHHEGDGCGCGDEDCHCSDDCNCQEQGGACDCGCQDK